MPDLQKIIITDVDNVLLSWEQQFHIWMEDRGYTQIKPGIYSIHETYDIVRDRASQLIEEFNTSAYIVGLPPFRDALQGVTKLSRAGYRFVAVTSIGRNPYTVRLRKINLDSLFGEGVFLEVHCVDDDKKPYLEKFRDSGFYWIEDLPENAVMGAELGLKSILITHLYNQEFTDSRVRRVDSWQEIADIILDNSGS